MRQRKRSILRHWQAVLTILGSTLAPWGGYFSGDVSTKWAAFLSLCAAVAAVKNWVDQSLQTTPKELPPKE
jgi:hypothetical protein